MKDSLKYTDVFVPGGFPKFTYNPRTTLRLEDKLESVLHNLCKLVVVTGHTKSGKTVLVRKVLPRETAVWIDGGGVSDENDFWITIIEYLSLFQTTGVSESSDLDTKATAKMSAEGGVLLAKGGFSLETSVGSTTVESSIKTREVTPKVLALTELKKTLTPIVIDDFHYLPKELQGSLIRALKPLIFDGLPVVVIAVPHRRYDAIKVEKEMTSRVLPIEIPLWSESELEFIPQTGFSLLDLSVNVDTLRLLTKESIGSPHLMQEFCREMSKIISKDTLREKLQIDTAKQSFEETAETIGRPIFEKLARGPRQRSDRKVRKLKNGEEVDIYGLVLYGLSHLRPELITLEYEELRSAIKEVCTSDDVPNIQEIARVLKYMAEIAATDQSSTPVIDFDEEAKLLHITDPFFAFYLRWGKLSK